MKLCNCNNLISFLPPPPHRILSRRPPPRFSVTSSLPSESTHRDELAESLQSSTLQILEWPAVCKQLSAFTSTSMGRSAALTARIPMGQSLEHSQRLLAQTSAAVAIPQPPAFLGIEDVSGILAAAEDGGLLSIRELCSVKRTLGSARSLLQQLKDISVRGDVSERCFPLLEILRDCDFLIELEQKIGFCIDCNFSVILDRASEELEIIRSERRRNMENLESLLKLLSTRIFQAGGINRPLVTRRRSRMCVALKASHRYLLPDGVVLDTSSSGSTYFVEPKEAIELNNMEVKLSNLERVEERTILSLLTSEISESRLGIEYLLGRILEVDLAFARASHARWLTGVCPNLSPPGHVERKCELLVDIEGIQHPLLLESSLRKLSDNLASSSKDPLPVNEENVDINSEISSRSLNFPVPLDIKIGNEIRVVVVSGPNTGGKTASMKTLGLASVMSKAGMYLPARGHPQLPWFDLVLADIGDQQSVEQSLSTFSGHISRIRKILEVASDKSLALIDEIGSGTDPSEGVALSTSILQYLKDRVNLAIITTHYADLTRLKEEDDRFENAAMEFSLETLKPTYRMLWGSTGESNALSIAKSIGFDGKIIEQALSWAQKLTPEKLQKQKGLLYQSLMEERNKLEAQAITATSLHTDIMNLYDEIQNEAEDLSGREQALKAKETQQIRVELSTVKAKTEMILQELENQLRTSGPDQLNELVKKAESAIAPIVEAHQPTDSFSVRSSGNRHYVPQIGERVLVKGLGNKLAMVLEAPEGDGTVLVQYGKITVRVHTSSIRAPGTEKVPATHPVSRLKMQGRKIQNLRDLKNLSEASSNQEVSYGPVLQTSKNSIDLRGMRVEEASRHLNMAINSTGPNSVLFIIHGMGTGVIKECAHQMLKNNPRVARFEQESPMNYGCTVAFIK